MSSQDTSTADASLLMGRDSKHTPGPWSFLEVDETDVFLMEGPQGDQGHSIYEGGFTREAAENGANASLIAAAPDLLAACKEAKQAFEEPQQASGEDPHQAAYDAVCAAITKAEAAA